MWITKDINGLFIWTREKPIWRDNQFVSSDTYETNSWNTDHVRISPESSPRELENGECIKVELNQNIY